MSFEAKSDQDWTEDEAYTKNSLLLKCREWIQLYPKQWQDMQQDLPLDIIDLCNDTQNLVHDNGSHPEDEYLAALLEGILQFDK